MCMGEGNYFDVLDDITFDAYLRAPVNTSHSVISYSSISNINPTTMRNAIGHLGKEFPKWIRIGSVCISTDIKL